MNKYEEAMVLFGEDCTISSQGGIIRVIANVSPGTTHYKDFEQSLATFLTGIEEIRMRITSAQWEWRMDFGPIDCSTGAILQLNVKQREELSDEEFIEKFPPKIQLDKSEVDILKLLELTEERDRARKRFRMDAARKWESLQAQMEIVKAGVAGVWEITQFDPANGTAFYSWELDLQDAKSRDQTVRIYGDTLDALVSAMEIADGTTIGLTARENSSLTEFLIGIDDPFS